MLYVAGIPRLRLLALTVALVLVQGCITEDFAGSSGEQTQQDTGHQDTGHQDTDEPDVTVPDSGDAGSPEEFGELAVQALQCNGDVPIFEVHHDDFADAKSHLFTDTAATRFGIGAASKDAFPSDTEAHAVMAASVTAGDELALGWSSVDATTLSSADADNTIYSRSAKFAGGAVIEVTGARAGDSLEVYDLTVFPPVSGVSSEHDGRHQIYNSLVLTNAGVLSCQIYGDIEDDQIGRVLPVCERDQTVKDAVDDAFIFPVRKLDYMVVSQFPWNRFIVALQGGAPSSLALFELTFGFLGTTVEPLALDEALSWDSDLDTPFFAQELAMGWSPQSQKYPLLYRLDNSGDPRGVTLAASFTGENVSSYTLSPGGEFSLPGSIDLRPQRFGFAFRLYGRNNTDDAANAAGYVGLRRGQPGVVFATNEPIGGHDWLLYDTPDVSRLWTFPTGGPALIALTRGNVDGHLELGSWNIDDRFRTVGGVVRRNVHGLEGIEGVRLHADWYVGVTNYDNLAELPGVLGFSAERDGTRAIYLADIPDVRDVQSLCDN